MSMQVSLDSSNASNVALSDEVIINIYNEYDASNISRGLKDNRVYFTRVQSLRTDKLTKFYKPCTWALLQTIDGKMEMTYLCSPPLNHIPRWLLHKYTFSKITIEEGIGHKETTPNSSPKRE